MFAAKAGGQAYPRSCGGSLAHTPCCDPPLCREMAGRGKHGRRCLGEGQLLGGRVKTGGATLPVPNVRTLTRSVRESFWAATSKGWSSGPFCGGCCGGCALAAAAALRAAACNGCNPGGIGCEWATVAAIVLVDRTWEGWRSCPGRCRVSEVGILPYKKEYGRPLGYASWRGPRGSELLQRAVLHHTWL